VYPNLAGHAHVILLNVQLIPDLLFGFPDGAGIAV
jgi:hypothetical protein